MPSPESSISNAQTGRMAEAASPANPLDGLRILIVEDNAYIAMALEEMLSEQGLVVEGVAASLEKALRLTASTRFDLALLDVNVGDKKIDPVAEALTTLGTPFVFTTGYGRAGLPEAFLDHPIVEKPFYIEEILDTLRAVYASAQDGGDR
ncbi:MAG: response regulator [Methylocystis sp.]